MTEQMTLEQVREQMARIMEPGDHLISAWINAIDAHLNAAKGEAVAWLVVADSSIWEFLESEDREIIFTRDLPSKEDLDGWHVTPLYAHPTSPDVVRDAERYRWLRDRCDTTTGFLLGHRIEAEEWDACIDAAMAAREGGE